MKTHLNVPAIVLLFFALISTVGCGKVAADLFGSVTQPSLGNDDDNEVPSFETPIGEFTLNTHQVLGKNKFLGIHNTSYGSLIEANGNVTVVGTDGIYEYTATGVQVKHIPINSAVYSGFLPGTPLTRSANGDYFIASSHLPYGERGILKISADGSTFTRIASAGSAHPIVHGPNDIKIIKRTSPLPEELHVTVMNQDPGGAVLDNEVEVYDLNGTYLRSYGLPQNTIHFYIEQSPITLDIYFSSMRNPNRFFRYDESGSFQDFFDVPSAGEIRQLILDNAGRAYILDAGVFGAGSDTGVHVYNITGSTLSALPVRQLLTSAQHTITSPFALSISGDGNFIEFQNQAGSPITRERYSWNGSEYVMTTTLNPAGSALGEFNFSTNGTRGTIAIDKAENIFVLEGANNRIQILNATGASLGSVPAKRNGTTQTVYFIYPVNSTVMASVGWYFDWVNSICTMYLRTYNASGTVLSDTDLVWPRACPMEFIGSDSQGRFWVNDSSTSEFLAVDVTGQIKKTVSYSNHMATFGVAAGMLHSVVKDSIFFVNQADYSLWQSDLDGNSTEVLSQAKLNGAGYLAGLTPYMNFLPDGKFYVRALKLNGVDADIIAFDTETKEVTTRLTNPTLSGVGEMVWTAQGIFATYNQHRLMQFKY